MIRGLASIKARTRPSFDLNVADIVSHPCLCIADIVSVHTLGHLTLVVNTIEAAKDMFERHSAVYSDRPQIPMLDLCVQNFFYVYVIIDK